MITVKAAPNPSATYGETVCVAGLSLDINNPGWIRLYPINHRELEGDSKFKKYDIVTLEAQPNERDPRVESWRPGADRFEVVRHLKTWDKRMPYLDDYVEESMCDLLNDVREYAGARSLAAVRPQEVLGLDIEPHPGWTPDEQAKINLYVNQCALWDSGPRSTLQAPRFKAWYRYRCHSPACKGHRQGIIDWELVGLQRSVHDREDAGVVEAIRDKFWDLMCAPDRDTIFYVGNQQAHPRSFLVLGVVYPRRPTPRSRS
ncbi:hypothetical protein Sru01_15530 [Sphaerisporangium rufum]|uniref:Uncharacterized protein n=1 Tax=Sphaerisporangium rufum TaxID=1381558 RepID=A0A919UX18_9ACTN|nr:hypothetical protein [Sphaerisporangium rufum]GII76571.1 hypothetical protein Sru01_15530 [Sphaerisporangium rufum]